MRVLVGCERSGVVREAFRARGHEAWSCDIEPADDGSPFHLQMDLNQVLYYPNRCLGGMPRWMRNREWDLMIAHPVCTYLCNSSVWALTKTPPNPAPGVPYEEKRVKAMNDAARFVASLWNAPIPRVAIENPVMHGAARYAIRMAGILEREARWTRWHDFGPATQSVQPYQFGDDASKRTCLWLRGLPKLRIPHEENWIVPRMIDGKPRWGNQTNSGQNRETPSPQRGRIRSVTYPGIAKAMAEQWGGTDGDLLAL